jgi:egghead protein (zeste-white 4 protein)
MNLYGTFRSYTYSAKHVGIGKLLVLFILGFVVQPFKYILEIIAILWGLVTPKNEFAIVDKNVEQNEMENTVSVVPSDANVTEILVTY